MSGTNVRDKKESLTELEYARTARASTDCRLLVNENILRLDERQNLQYFSNPHAFSANTYPQLEGQVSPPPFLYAVSDEEGVVATQLPLVESTIPLHDSRFISRNNDDCPVLGDREIVAGDQRVLGGPQLQTLNRTADELDSFHHGHLPVQNFPKNQDYFFQENAPESPMSTHPLSLIHEYYFKLKVDQEIRRSFHVDDDGQIAKRPIENELASTAAINGVQYTDVALPQLASRHTQCEELQRDIARLPDNIQTTSIALSPSSASSPLPQPPAHAWMAHPIACLEDNSRFATNELTTSILTNDEPYNLQNDYYSNVELQSDSNYTLAPPANFFEFCSLDASSNHFSDLSSIPRGLGDFLIKNYMTDFSASSYHPLSEWLPPPPIKLETRPSTSNVTPPRPQHSSDLFPSWMTEPSVPLTPPQSSPNSFRSWITEAGVPLAHPQSRSNSFPSWATEPPVTPCPASLGSFPSWETVPRVPLTHRQSSTNSFPSWSTEPNGSSGTPSPSTENFLISTTTEVEDSPIKTKKARGRRPLTSSDIQLTPSETSFLLHTGGKVFETYREVNLNPELLQLCEIKKKAGWRKIFMCQVDNCGKCFRRSEHLHRHVRSMHTNDQPYKCPWYRCEKAFNRRDNLKQHVVKIHRPSQSE